MGEELTRKEIIANLEALEVEEFDEGGQYVDTGELLCALGLECDGTWTALEGVQRLIEMLKGPGGWVYKPGIPESARCDGKPWYYREGGCRPTSPLDGPMGGMTRYGDYD